MRRPSGLKGRTLEVTLTTCSQRSVSIEVERRSVFIVLALGELGRALEPGRPDARATRRQVVDGPRSRATRLQVVDGPRSLDALYMKLRSYRLETIADGRMFA